MKLVKVGQENQNLATYKFFTYRQNNTGGSFSGPALYVIVEAINASDADVRAEMNGVYFNGCDSGSDCECCGDRWYTTYGEGDAVPTVGATALSEMDEQKLKWDSEWCKADKLAYAIVVYRNGNVVTYNIK